DGWNAQRRATANLYSQLLEGISVVRPIERPASLHVYHRYGIRTQNREHVRRQLTDRGVATFVQNPVPTRRLVGTSLGHPVGTFRVAEQLASEVFYLPIYPEIDPDQVVYVAECLRAIVAPDEARALEMV